MVNQVQSDRSANWRASAVLGLITSTFSTVIASLTAARIGRDAIVDWMVVASIPLRDPMLQAEPSWLAIVAGILFHQWADFSWAMVFFGLLGRWTALRDESHRYTEGLRSGWTVSQLPARSLWGSSRFSAPRVGNSRISATI